jgi:hypothetical protein
MVQSPAAQSHRSRPNAQGYIPLPNAGTNNFIPPSVVTRLRDDKAGQRVDFNNKKTGNWDGYYHFDESTSVNLGTYGPAYGNFGAITPKRTQQAVLANVRAIGASAVNEARLDFTRVASVSNQPTDPPVTLQSLGFVTGTGTLGVISSGPDTWQSVPPISLSGQINFSFGRNISSTGQFNNTWHAADSFAKIWGKHAFKFGGDYRYLQINERNIYAPNGNFSFDGSETGHDVADFLLGAPSSYIQAALQVLDSRTRYGAVFAQDSWRIASNFTLNYGLRWEASMPWYDTQDKIETIVPGVQSTVFPGSPKGWLVPGDPGLPGGGQLLRLGAPSGSPPAAGHLSGGGVAGPLFPRERPAFAAAGIYYTASGRGLSSRWRAPYGLFWEPPVLDQYPGRWQP